MSVKPTGDHSIEVLTNAMGKPWTMEKITVSPDGKTMTTVADKSERAEFATFVDEKQ